MHLCIKQIDHLNISHRTYFYLYLTPPFQFHSEGPKSVGSFDAHYGNAMTSLPAAPLGAGIGPNMGAESHNLMQNQTQYHGVSQVKRVKQTKAQTQALSQSVVTNMSANVNNFNGNQSQPGNNQYANRGSNTGVCSRRH
jgi:hypothetical protein